MAIATPELMDEVIIYAPWFTPRTKAPMNYRRKSPARKPREEEVRLLLSLRSGPRRVNSGPLGQCLKKGWCAFIEHTLDDAGQHGAHAPMVELTHAGEQIAAEFAHGSLATIRA